MYSSANYVIAAYTIGFVLLWGYAGLMWMEGRAAARRQSRDDRKNAGGQS
jgi:hypothetical protein